MENDENTGLGAGQKILSVIIILMIAIFAPVILDNCDRVIYVDNSASTTNKSAKTYYIGESVTSGHVEFIVTEVKNTKRISLIATTENNFIIITLKLKNIGNEEVIIQDECFLLTKGNKEYKLSSESALLDDGFCMIETIGADINKTISIVFETSTENSNSSPFTLTVKGEKTLKTGKDIKLTSKPA